MSKFLPVLNHLIGKSIRGDGGDLREANEEWIIAYQVKSLPDVPFDVGEMYAGLMPIDMKNSSRGLYFVFEPTVGEEVDEITIWMNGGPGEWCSFNFVERDEKDEEERFADANE
ncbi:hypothetical protein ACMFMF_001365 [Clarireedia jacksonii]